MRLSLVSDVHGAFDSLPGIETDADVTICLGDFLLFIDYEDPSQGAFAEVFGESVAREYVALRLAKKFDEARELSAREWQRVAAAHPGEDRAAAYGQIVERQYREAFANLPGGTYVIPGNVDVPHVLMAYADSSHRLVDGQVVEIDGVRFGFVGGGVFSPYRTPNERDPGEYAQMVESLPPVDVLCTHLPPQHPLLQFDVVAHRFEVASAAINAYLLANQPRYHFFGHVHQPLAQRARIGFTECINVGHFRARRRPLRIDL